jgi:hypothetical protein
MFTKRNPKMRKSNTRALAAFAVLAMGTAFQLPSCKGLLTTVNPCGTIFAFCTPEQLDLVFADIPDYDLDPTCSIPFFGITNSANAGTCGQVNVFGNVQGIQGN